MEALERVIRDCTLVPLALEGGWYRRIGTSAVRLPDGREAWSEIDFLISPDGFSAMHRLATAETWTFRGGAAAEILLLGPGPGGQLVRLGPGGVPAVRVAPGVWQGARTLGAWSRFTCRVEPAWRDADFELGDSGRLTAEFPAWAEAIHARVRPLPGGSG